MITPQDIENKVFSSALKGYRREEVDQYLDEMIVEVQALLRENETLKSNIQDLRREVENRKASETSIMKTLEQAKTLMSDISASAEKRAEAIIRNAQAEAERLMAETKERVAGMTKEAEEIHSKANDFRDRYSKMLREELGKLESGGPDFFREYKDDFFPASMEQSYMAPREGAFQSDLQELFQSGEETPEPVSDVETLFEEIETEASAPGPKDTLQGVAPSQFKTESVDEMAKTIVIDPGAIAGSDRE